MDLIYTNAQKEDQGVLSAYSFDLSFGASENDFEISLGPDEPALEFGAFVYIEGTEYGGIVDGLKTATDSDTSTYLGRTWHGMMNSKIIEPDIGADYLIVSGEANEILAMMIDRLGLGALFAASAEASGINISSYKFHRYCKGYDGILDMLSDNGAKLKVTLENREVILSAVPIADYTEAPVDGDTATLDIERHKIKVNHLVCLGKGDLAEREVIHLFVNQKGAIVDEQYYFGLDEVADTYENTGSTDLRSDGVKKLKELRDNDKADISVTETVAAAYDIGDIVGADDIQSGNSVTATVTQKIVKIKNGVISTDYKTGGD